MLANAYLKNVIVVISLNDSCNLNCIYCFNKSNRKYRNNSSSCTLSVDNIVSVLKEYKEIGGKTVVYTGGEPTLNKDFFNIVSEVNKIGLKQEVITNGTLLNSLNVAELVKYISRINISIDSNRQEELKQLWNVSNFDYYYSELINGLNRLDEVLAMYPQIDFSICVLPVITSINILSVEQLMLEISKYTHFKTSWKFTKYSLIQDEKIDKLLDISMEDYLEFLKKIGKNILRLNEEKSIEFAVTHCGERSIREKPTLGLCNPGFFITYHGDVYPCQGLEKEEYFLGSIFNNTLKELFYSDCFCEVRKHLFPQYIEKCHSCELRYVCTERCSLCNIECKEIDCKDAVIRRMYYKLKSNGVSL